MAVPLEDYALIGNRRTAALVASSGAIDWLCLPRFDGGACFAALVGGAENGCWEIGPCEEPTRVMRQYRGASLVLETRFETPSGDVMITDCMGERNGNTEITRQIQGLRGSTRLRFRLRARFEYGRAIPAITQHEDGAVTLVSGPDRLTLFGDCAFNVQDHEVVSEFEMSADENCNFSLTWSPSYEPHPARGDCGATCEAQARFWQDWGSDFHWRCEWPDPVRRSLIVLKGLSSARTGGMVAAPTTSLPEQLGGKLNWDYRFCWLRDATLALRAFLHAGLTEEAEAWRGWLLRALGGDASQIQIMYGIAGERRLDESTIGWLAGYEGSTPVHLGNGAAEQLQLDIYGDLMDALYLARKKGASALPEMWDMECRLMTQLAKIWREPGSGIWEARGSQHQYTLSKAMASIAFERAAQSAEEFGLQGPVEEWRRLADEIKEEVCQSGFNKSLNAFVQYYGGSVIDASLLRLAPMGFLPASDPRILGTIAAIERELLVEGLVFRYKTKDPQPGLPSREGAFIACGFWLAENYQMSGRHQEARQLFERLLGIANDVGLLSEEYDLHARRLVGNFPQALSHLALINTAFRLSSESGTR